MGAHAHSTTMNTVENDYCVHAIEVTTYVRKLRRHDMSKFFANKIQFVCTRCGGCDPACHARKPHRWFGTHFLQEALAVMRKRTERAPPVALRMATIHQLASAAAAFPLYFGPCAATEWKDRCSSRSLPPIVRVEDALNLIVAGIASSPVVVYAYPPQWSAQARAVRQWNKWLVAHRLHRGWAHLVASAVERATGLPREIAWHIVGFVLRP